MPDQARLPRPALLYPSPVAATPQREAYRRAIGQFTTGVTIVTARGDEEPLGTTANAVSSLSLDPILLIVCLDLGSRTLGAVRETRQLAVNVLARHQEPLAVSFASKAPGAEKFRGVPYHEEHGVPVLEGVVAWFTGRVTSLVPGGDHEIAVTEVLEMGSEGGDPLVFHAGAYRSLAD